MASSKYQPVPRYDRDLDSTEPSSTSLSQEYAAQHEQSWHRLDALDVSDLSSKEDDDDDDSDDGEGDDEADNMISPPNDKKQKRSPRPVRKLLSRLKTSIVRNRLYLVAAAGLIFILLPLIAYQRTIRAFFWGEQVYVSSSTPQHFDPCYIKSECMILMRTGARNPRHGIRRLEVGPRRAGLIAIRRLKRWYKT